MGRRFTIEQALLLEELDVSCIKGVELWHAVKPIIRSLEGFW
jgi:hypothetical protein